MNRPFCSVRSVMLRFGDNDRQTPRAEAPDIHPEALYEV